MFLEIEDNIIKIQNIVRVSRVGHDTVIIIKDSEPVKFLDTNGDKYKKIIDKLDSCYDVITVN